MTSDVRWRNLVTEVTNKSARHETGVIIKEVMLGQGVARLNLTGAIACLILNEDIEKGFITGTLLTVDDFLMSKDVLDGTETVDITFSSHDQNYIEYEEPYTKRFRVTKYEQTIQQGLGSRRSLVLHLVSPASIKNDSIKLFRSYTNTSSSAFVNQCCDLMGVDGKRFIEETLHAKHFVAPNVSPMDMINWTKLTSQSKENGGSDFYFFENKDGVHFKSLETLKSMEPTQTLIFKGNVVMESFNAILKMTKPKGYDVQDDIRYGGAGATLYTHDLCTKEYRKHTIDPSTISKLNPVDPRGETYERSPDSYVQFWPHNHSYETLDRNSTGHSALTRSIAKTRINYKTMLVEIAGNIAIKSGDIIKVRMPGLDGIEQVSESGKWLVKKIKHTITPASYYMNLELVTDGSTEFVDG